MSQYIAGDSAVEFALIAGAVHSTSVGSTKAEGAIRSPIRMSDASVQIDTNYQ